MLSYIDLLSKEFEYGGRGPDKYDCYGLVKEIYHRLGIELPEYSSVDDYSLINQMINQGKELFVKIDEPEAYCVALFNILPGYTSHIAVVMENRRQFIHIAQKLTVSVERLGNQLWRRRLQGFYKWEN